MSRIPTLLDDVDGDLDEIEAIEAAIQENRRRDARPMSLAGRLRSDREDAGTVVHLTDYRPGAEAPPVTVQRRELDTILRLYGRMVAAGEWRDYAIDHLKEKAVFSAFRRTSEVPLYRIEKTPRNARRQGAFSVVTASGMILKRGHELETVLRVLEKKPKLIHG